MKSMIALMADTEAILHQVHIALKDANVIRFLWLPQNDPNKELEEFHLFGGRCVSNFAFANNGR